MKQIILSFLVAVFMMHAYATVSTIHTIANTYSPKNDTIYLGDTIFFLFTGAPFESHPTAPDNGTDWATFPLDTGNINKVLVLTSPGNYPYYCTNHGSSGGGGMSGNILVIEPAASIKESNQVANFFFLYPNRIKVGELVTVTSLNSKLGSIEIYDVLGRKLDALDDINQANYQLNTANLHAGMYFIKIESGKLSAIRRLLVTR